MLTQEKPAQLRLETSEICDLFKPIYFSRDDTPETQDQIVDYLITLNAVCNIEGDN